MNPDKHDDHLKTVEVSVNSRDVRLPKERLTGAEIKTAAIAQGVAIELNFVLQQELPNGTSPIIGDADEIKVKNHDRFTAIAPDDNS